MSFTIYSLWHRQTLGRTLNNKHDDVIKWKHFSRYWPFMREIHRSPVNSPHKGQWRGALMFSLIWTWRNGWAIHRDADDLRRHCAHYDVTVIETGKLGIGVLTIMSVCLLIHSAHIGFAKNNVTATKMDYIVLNREQPVNARNIINIVDIIYV